MSSSEVTCEAPSLKPLEDALAELLASVAPLDRRELRQIHDTQDCILAEDIHSNIDVPGFDNSAMDGYALHIGSEHAEAGENFRLVGQAFAGQSHHGAVAPGECIRIMTGAEVPSDCNAVVMQEQCSVDGDTIHVQNSVKLGNNIRLRGNDIAEGDSVLKQGQRLNPAKLGVLASLGIAEVQVFKPLTVALFASGDELRAPDEPLDPGCIYESNRFVVQGMLQRLGMKVMNLGIIKDDPAALEEAFLKAAATADAIVCSGGVSVGDADHTKDVLAKVGQVEMWKLAIKPGKPFAFGRVQGIPFFGLPGNPSSAAITFHQLALPCLCKLNGELTPHSLSLQLAAPQAIRKRSGRTDFQRGVLTYDNNGQLQLEVFNQQSSGMLSTLAAANCYIKIERERGDVTAGEDIEVIPFDRWMI
ncbi:gephyrin-like molybdotransferase Glp [Pseudoteredinibacter isoporae]|uniref:Molybdopterin molybdenumtransferase n=1 Tax=Pseudoteredinibacter isoporae TaxID=570281 RepID=A0A7X0JVC4_9GAMM|nr:gephyrin-like molybdotransferase Glp [Pseudoteredinibacter isoporae]MBB6521976.1 molybdopterin molybdotransferase [Pseudoteredinibacter isoporae]NHO87512.1 molybdopterin molybdotransferase MoeA [Pseudoteredinibacter isoporae]NIB24157.1 molybdopterin molybdotransferase MoeA [Pseudoteredinibacter isoporae]